ncbi:MAG TPA: tRNA pseudouridine(55) synthase TruB [Polyangiaceae bacterium]
MVRVGISGVLVIDKPVGPTSHDVVAHLRRALGTRAVGHAGTLDPRASGVLVMVVGEATKLVAHLSLHEKQYEAWVTFGVATNTLDAEGAIVATAALPPDLADDLSARTAEPAARGASVASALERALEGERSRQEQVPPAFSAIKLNGRAVHRLARRGERVELPARPVEVRSLEVTGTTADSVGLVLTVSKGYFVRSLARDLGDRLNVPAHLSSLRRLSSGPFTLAEALPPSTPAEELCRAMQPLAEVVARVLPTAKLSEEGVRRARCGKLLSSEHFTSVPAHGPTAWLSPSGDVVAVGRAADELHFAVDRGFGQPTSSSAT